MAASRETDSQVAVIEEVVHSVVVAAEVVADLAATDPSEEEQAAETFSKAVVTEEGVALVALVAVARDAASVAVEEDPAEVETEAVVEVATEAADAVAAKMLPLSIKNSTSTGRRAASRSKVSHNNQVRLINPHFIAQQDLDRELEEYQQKA